MAAGKRKFTVHLEFVADVEIEAVDEKEAIVFGEDLLDSHSVYSDEKIDEMHDEAYYAGASGGDPPLRKKRAYTLRNQDFEPGEVHVTEQVITEVDHGRQI